MAMPPHKGVIGSILPDLERWWNYPQATGTRPTVRPCTCPLRINIAGSPVDRHRGKKAWTRGLAWYPSGPFTPGDALTAGRVGAHRLCRPPPRAASHHSCVLTLPPAAARVAHETITLRATSRHGPSVPPPWPASRAATVWRSPSHGSAGAV